ncbi:MAG: hypothetical protein WAM29_13960 [Methylocella sp.]
MNSPFLDAARWDAEVAKTIKRLARQSIRRAPRPSGLISKRITGSEALERRRQSAPATNLARWAGQLEI